MLEKLKCNHYDISIPERDEVDFNALIPASLIPVDEVIAEIKEFEDNMSSGVGSDAMPEPIFNELIEHALQKGDTRDVLMYVIAANFGVRMSDCRKFTLLQFINSDGEFRHRLYREEQKTSKTRVFYINKAIEAAIILYLRNHPNQTLTDPLFVSEGKNQNWVKETYIDERGREKALRKNGKYVYKLDENGNRIPSLMTHSPIEEKLKKRLKDIGAPVAVGKSVKDGEFKLTTHSFRKAYGMKFTRVAMDMKQNNEIILDSDVLNLISMDYMHSNVQTTLRYVKDFERAKEAVCSRINLGLDVLKRYL